MSKPKLILSWPYIEWGGAQTYLLDVVRRAAGFDVRAVLPAGSSPTLLGFLADLAVECEFLPARFDLSAASSPGRRLLRRARKIRTERLFARRLENLIDDSTLLHVDFAPWSSHRLLTRLARRAPTFMTLHTRLPPTSRAREHLCRARLRGLMTLPRFHLLASSRDCRDSLCPYLGEAACDRVPVAYPAFDVSEVPGLDDPRARAALCQRLALPADRLLVVVAAQFIERKGCWTFLEAASRLVTSASQLHFVWLGTEDLAATTVARIASSPAAEHFHYVPSRLSGTTRADFLGAVAALADIFVLPSLVEGLPLALGEAMALGKPVVASRINAVPEAICHDENGLLIGPGDAPALAEAIARLAASAELRQRLGRAARATVAARFGAPQTTDVTLAAYRAALRSCDSLR
ncbi:MAG: glycosyltransferase family 4 protein [Thermoanaerobaculia bacterium]